MAVNGEMEIPVSSCNRILHGNEKDQIHLIWHILSLEIVMFKKRAEFKIFILGTFLFSVRSIYWCVLYALNNSEREPYHMVIW